LLDKEDVSPRSDYVAKEKASCFGAWVFGKVQVC
jgi:hypothetical protein